ncbi:MAG: PorV/PorQ family protein [Ignavibacteria bacterium]|nr:PorV/PorQ family protein [Ignavibacteria bacterium]
MKNKKIFAFLLILVCLVIPVTNGQDKLAQTGMKFLQLSTDAKAAAMGDAVTGLEGNSSSMFFNPAAMARQKTLTDITIGQINHIADIKYYYVAASFAPYEGQYGVFGLNFEYVNYGELQATVIAQNQAGYEDIGTFKPKAYCAGLSYAKALSEQFSIGGTVKYAVQDLGSSVMTSDTNGRTTKSYKPNSLVFDFGMLFHTGIKSLDFGVSIRNFNAKEVKLENEGYQLPLMFQIGFAFNLSDVLDLNKEEHSIQLAVDANHPRDYSEQIMLGCEYTFQKMISFRVGYEKPNDEHGFTYGIGFKKNVQGTDIGIDYAYVPWTTFSDVHRFTLHFAL